ncbi:MAG: GTP cyclohydrolase I [Labilithrix sp.]|nr:GTP cyclohydrolase I [Labilithrix sp.]MCW5811100.1 GTP cyclohydrolase I [Labilithrix sp.]
MTTPDRQAAAAAIDAFLRALGVASEETAGTGERVAQMFAEDLCAGYAVDTKALVEGAVIDVSRPSLVVVRDVAVTTTCPHHLLPSMGRATVAFKATTRAIGLGAVAALVDAHARRLALQEHIGEGVVDDLDACLRPDWVGCRLVLAHGCMIARGERAIGTTVETVALRGPPDRVSEAHRALGVGA